MKLEERRLIDQALVAEEPCLGAVFCSYTFDPAYFEEHVLRSLLRLRGDPDEDAARYHDEARAALREVPIACFVDASVRRGGQRLPYDRLLVRRRVFHPKVMLVLYASEARVAVGSGNLTKSGLEQNTELFFVRSLRYDDPAHAAALRDVGAFLDACASVATHRGTQFGLVRAALDARLGDTRLLEAQERVDARFVSTFTGPLLEQLDAILPVNARITRVGVLAPFFEQDDLDAAHDGEGLTSVLRDLLALRPSPTAVLDLGVPWDDAPLAPPPTAEPPTLDGSLGALWARRSRETTDVGRVERMQHFTVERAGARRVEALDAGGVACRFDRADLEAAIGDGRLWPVERPTVFAPRHILAQLTKWRAVQLWLHPTTDLSASGRPRRRPLHAKVFLVTTSQSGRVSTYALVGSANASRSALARGVAERGNVEAGVICRFDGEVTLRDMVPSLVAYSLDGVNLVERETMTTAVDLSAWITDVVHDAAARNLTVTWQEQEHGPGTLGRWTLRYLDRELASGNGRPAEPTVLANFDLAAASSEVAFLSDEREWLLPIRVADLAMLPVSPELAALGLRELLALLGRRIGAERLVTLRVSRGPLGVASVLDAVFGEGFGPTDVFKAWWGAVEDLSTAPTVASFRHHLLGPTSVGAAWTCLLEAVRNADDEQTRDEVWVYGSELFRELSRVQLADGPDAPVKRGLLGELCARVGDDLVALAPAAPRPWFGAVADFYELGGRHDGP